MKLLRTLVCLPAAGFSGLCLAQSEQCSALQSAFTDANIRVTTAEYQAASTQPAGPFGPGASLPAHCHVEGDFDRRTGADGKPYAIRFAISLPDNWNGRFLFQGGGGLNGSLGEPTGGQATGGTSALSRGFAVASTDSGHEGSVFDSSFMADQEAMLNFYYLANARVTEVVRPMVEAYYRDDIDYSYFVGCSTGGREGMIMAQRHPMLYDGIVSGAPAIRTGLSNLGLRWISDQLGQAANTQPRDPFTEAEESLIMTALMNSCDTLDGQQDGLIMNTEACDFDPVELSCSVTGGNACLADDKAQALAKAMSGPVDSRGVQVYPRFRYDSGIDDTGGIPGLLLAGGSPPVPNPTGNAGRQNVDAEFIDATSTDSALGDSTQYNVSTFIARGGKHLFYHGVSDPWFSAQDTVDYFTQMGTTNANLKPVEEYSALYMVPGAGHCQGGEQTLDNFDMLTPLVEWVENGVAPEGIIATGQTMPGVSRPLCPFPGYAQYLGSGDVNLAENYACQVAE